MYLKKSTRRDTGRTHLTIVHGFWDPVKKVSRIKTVKPIGYLDELEKEYSDPITHFTQVAAEMDADWKNKKSVSITLEMDAQIERGAANRKNYGHVVFSKIYHELEIDRFLKNARRHEPFKFNTDAIMRLLIFGRLLYPRSKRATVFDKEQFFENFNFSLDDVYDALTHFNKVRGALQQHLHEKVTEQYQRETDVVYYDVTNYYFEIDKEDEHRKKGPSKEKRKSPIAQMGLLLDKSGLPISYKMFPGNTHDSQTLMPTLTEVKRRFNTERIIVVADKGLNSSDNMAYNTVLGDGYIYSKSIRGASEAFKKWVLDEKGYRQPSDKYKLKSQIVPNATIHVTVEQNGKKKRKKKMEAEQKWIVFYSEKYALRANHKREEAIAKALKMIENPAMYKSTFDYGAAGYVSNLKIDKETGELMNIEDRLLLDEEKIAEEEKYDGYYALITSELDDDDTHIIDLYRGLWRIEESFKVTKSVFSARPVYLRGWDHINAHFLVCFISLLIARIVEMRLGGRYTIEKITDVLRQVSASHLDQNLWLFNYADHITDEMNAAFDTDFGRKIMSLEEIKKNLGSVKKR